MTDDELLKKIDELAEIGVKKSGKKPSMKSGCHIYFDGENLDLYQNDNMVDSISAMSGQKDHQKRADQSIRNKGPIPEGRYWLPQEKRQVIDTESAVVGLLPSKLGRWSGSIPAWGLRRAWIDPDENTNTYGRDGFSIHGGWSKGSAGCIDIPWNTHRLSDYLDDCQDVVPLDVKYKKEKW